MNKQMKQIIISILIIVIAGWIAWVSNGIVRAESREQIVCSIKEDIQEIKQGINRLRDYFGVP